LVTSLSYIKNIGVWRFLKAIEANERPPNVKFGYWKNKISTENVYIWLRDF
jgi:hypothetical protein